MSTQLKLRRGTTAQHSAFTGAEGEVTVDTTKDTLVVHNGTTAGGKPVLTEVNPSYTGTLTGGTGVVNLGSGQVYKDASGNVGIGTSAPIDKLVVLASNYRGVTLETTTSGNRPTLSFRNTSGAGAIAYIQGDGQSMAFGRAAQDYGSHVESLRLDSSGNVGIGTSSPAYKFDISGGHARIRGAQALFWSNSDNTNAVGIYNGGSTGTSLGQMVFETANTERARIDSGGNWYMNSGYGSVAVAYGCRAWVNFNGTGTVSIRGSGNVSSITDNGVGDYRINFTTALPDVNYSVNATTQSLGGTFIGVIGINASASNLTTSVAIKIFNLSAAATDVDVNCVSVFR